MTTVNDLLITSPDLRAERLEELKRLLPDLFTEGGQLNAQALAELVDENAAPTKERYEFNWTGKAQAKRHAFTPSRAALTYDAERSVNPEKADGNLIIEGENLEVLKLLSAAYREQVKCIYIDPPYNRDGDYIYVDNYARARKAYWEDIGAYENGIRVDTNTESTGRFHSDWLSMMYGRLLVARQLLRADGVIFISIDDHELHNLRRLLDEVFGEENFLGCVVRATGTTTGQDAGGFGSSFDYLLVYSKSDAFELYGIPLSEKDKTRFSYEDSRGRYSLLQLRKTGNADRREDRPKMYYSITAPDGSSVYPIGPTGYESRWRFGRNKYSQAIKDDLIEWKEVEKDGEKRWVPYVKYYLEGRTKRPSPLWTDIDGNKKASLELKKIFNSKVFDNPKPVDLLRRIITLATEENDIVLDFFAGSGSTGQAVLELNQNEGTTRRFILVQLPESIPNNHVAYRAGYRKISEITIDRCKKVIEGYGDEPQPLDTGFKVYQLTKSHFPRVDFQPDPDKTNEENVELLKQYIAEKESSFQLAFEQDKVLDEVLLKHGFMLDYSLTQVDEIENNTVYLAQDSHREALICLDLSIDGSTVDYFKQHTDKPFICLERALDTTRKWNLKHALGDRLKSI